MTTRISRESMLLEMAYTASKRGTCGRLAVGAIIARDSRPISLGYVGAPKGCAHCEENGCDLTKPCTRTIHAEANAIKAAHNNMISVTGADMFVTNSPCLLCATIIVGAGLHRVYYDQEYRVRDGIEHLNSCGVKVYRVLHNGMIHQITE